MFLVEVVRAALLFPIILFNSVVPHMQVYAVRADQCRKKDKTTVLCFRGPENNACVVRIVTTRVQVGHTSNYRKSPFVFTLFKCMTL
jgi:hypothetical protein